MAVTTAQRPRIGLDLHFVDGRVQGLRTHCVEMFSRVVRATPEIDFYCIMAKTELLQKEGFTSPNVIPVRIRRASHIERYGFAIASAARKHKLDLLHCQFSAPPIVPCRTAITIHDILAKTHPEYFGRIYRLLASISQTIAVRHASQIYTVSEYCRQEIARVYKISEGKVTVLLNGVNTERFTPSLGAVYNEVERYGLVPAGYILTVGRLEPRKNHRRIFQAYAKLPPARPPLVLVGQKDFGYQGALKTIEELGIQNEVRILQDVGDDELPKIYRNAKIFIYASLAEGFGMPVLEAMAAGVPVVTSNNTALVEVAGDAAVLVDATSVDSIAKALEDLLRDPTARENLIRRGREHLQRFTWDRSAELLRKSYFNLLSGAQTNRVLE